MDDIFGYMVVACLIIGFTLSLISKIQMTITLQRTKKNVSPTYKRTLISHYITCISLAGVIISYSLNTLVAMQVITSTIITSNTTSLSCITFLIILLITKLMIIPKNNKSENLAN